MRRVVADSVLCVGVAAIAARLRPRQRIAAGSGAAWMGEQEIRIAEQRDAQLAGSRLMGALCATAAAVAAAWRAAQVRRLLEPVFGLDLPERIRAAAGVVLIAAFTHTVLLAALGVSVHVFGWSFRAGLAGASLIALWRPEPLAAAWKDRAARGIGSR